MNLTSERGRIQPPDLDDRTWQDLVDEMIGLIPTYAPQWTDHNPSDLGITLIELFAWLVEQLIYRLNRVPEKNYIAFLNLLGITRDPLTPARTFVTFSATADTVVAKGVQVQTQGSEREAPVVFETDADLAVLPVNLTQVLVVNSPGNAKTSILGAFALPPSEGYTLTVAGKAKAQICLGFDLPTDKTLKLATMFSRPLPRPDPGKPASYKVTWHYSANDPDPFKWPQVPGFDPPANSSMRQVADLQQDGVVELKLPAGWAKQDAKGWVSPPEDKEQSGYWLAIRIENTSASPLTLGTNFILFNAVAAHTALTLTAQAVGEGSGLNFQVFSLQHRPLFRRPDSDDSYDHLVVKVDDVVWRQKPDLLLDLDVHARDTAYLVDPVVGEIRFGGGGRGAAPPQGSKIVASYRYVAGGAIGNVGADKVVTLRQPIGGVTIAHSLAAAGGSDEEPIEQALRRAPGLLKTRDRAITAEDYEYLAREATAEVRIVRCLEPAASDARQYAGLNRSPGIVNVIIVPDLGLDVLRPRPTLELIQRVQGYLGRRRDLTVNLIVTGPRYLPVQVTAKLVIWQRAKDSGIVENEVKRGTEAKIAGFLHPTRGGLDGRGWHVGQHVFAADLFKAIMPPEDTGYIESLTVQAMAPDYTPPQRPFSSAAGATARVADYESVCSADAHLVTVRVEA